MKKREMASSITIFFADCRYKEKRGLKKLCTLYMHSVSSPCVIQRAGFGQIILFVVEKILLLLLVQIGMCVPSLIMFFFYELSFYYKRPDQSSDGINTPCVILDQHLNPTLQNTIPLLLAHTGKCLDLVSHSFLHLRFTLTAL